MAITKLATQCPAPQVVSSIFNLNTYDESDPVGAALDYKAASYITTGDTIWGNDFNRNAAYLDALGQCGGGSIGIISGLAISAGAGLVCNVALGTALIGGIIQIDANTTIVVTASQTNAIWLKDDGTLESRVGVITAPSIPGVFLGFAITDGSGITSIDTSGVISIYNGISFRQTADALYPADTPSSSWRGITRTAIGDYFWNGSVYNITTHSYRQTRSVIGAGLTLTAAATNYLPIEDASALIATETDTKIKLSKDTVFRNLRILLKTVGVTVGTCTVTMRVNGADSILTVSFTSGSSIGWIEDTTNVVSCSAGNEINFKVVGATTGSPVITAICVDELGKNS